MKFQGLWNKFSFLFGQLCNKKTCAFVVMGIGGKDVWAGGGMKRSSSGQFPFCCCVCVCGAEGGLSGLGGHDQVSNVATAAKYLQPSSFTITCTIVKYSLPVS